MRKFPLVVRVLASTGVSAYVSAASLWEIAIKTRLRKLDILVPLERLPEVLESYAIEIVGITARHALAEAGPQPLTRDPFDRMLLAQCRLEEFRLVTIDRVLAEHPLTWRDR